MSSTIIKINEKVSMVISVDENKIAIISTQPGKYPITLDKGNMQAALIALHEICEKPASIYVQYPDRLTSEAKKYFLGQCIDRDIPTNVTSNATNRVPTENMFICNTTIQIPTSTERSNSPENVTPPVPPNSPSPPDSPSPLGSPAPQS